MKRKFGGNGESRGACQMKKCTNLQQPPPKKEPSPIAEVPNSKKRSSKKRVSDANGSPGNRLSEAEEIMNQMLKSQKFKSSMYGRPLPKFSSDKCAAPNCLFAKSSSSNVLVKCIGFGCTRLYHKKCAEAISLEICGGEDDGQENPGVSFSNAARTIICPDCDYYGSSVHLLRYFETFFEERAQFESSHDFVLQTLKEGSKSDDDSCDTTTPDRDMEKLLSINDGLPRSEVSFLSEILSDIRCASFLKKRSSPSKVLHKKSDDLTSARESSTPQISASFFVGKIIYLYCPNDNFYHHGRVIDYRRAPKPKLSSTVDEGKSYFYGTCEAQRTEYLVVFKAGIDGRKKTIQQWLIFEEHSLAVSCAWVWAHHNVKLSNTRTDAYRPAQVVLRTSIELMAKRDSYRELLAEKGKFWGMCSFDQKNNSVLRLKTSTIPFLHPMFDNIRRNPIDRMIAIGVGNATTDLYEQERTFKWHEMYLSNPFHKEGLSILNYDSVKDLHNPLRSHEQHNDSFVIPQVCPSFSHGLDHLLVASMLPESSIDIHCKDVVSDLKCEKRNVSKRKAIQLAMATKRKRMGL